MAKLWRHKIQNRLRMAGVTPTRQHVKKKINLFSSAFLYFRAVVL